MIGLTSTNGFFFLVKEGNRERARVKEGILPIFIIILDNLKGLLREEG